MQGRRSETNRQPSQTEWKEKRRKREGKEKEKRAPRSEEQVAKE